MAIAAIAEAPLRFTDQTQPKCEHRRAMPGWGYDPCASARNFVIAVIAQGPLPCTPQTQLNFGHRRAILTR